MKVRRGDIEQALTYHYLRSDGPSGSSPLRYIDVTEPELALALKDVLRGDDVRGQFMDAFDGQDVVAAFKNGSRAQPLPGSDTPGWFGFLILACVIYSIGESDEVEDNNFRHRLEDRYRLNEDLGALRGLPLLWRALEGWMASERKRGRPFRDFVLPDPGRLSYVGHAWKLTFPTWRDDGRLRALFAEVDRQARSHAFIVDRISDALDRPWSEGFLAAFAELRSIRSKGIGFLALHPFVRYVTDVEAEGRRTEHGVIDAWTDVDGETSFRADPPLAGANEFDDADDLVRALRGETLSGPWRSCVTGIIGGAVPFGQGGFGVWRSNAVPNSAEVRLLVSPEVSMRFFGKPVGRGWTLTDPMPIERASTLMSDGPDPTGAAAMNAGALLEGGHRVGRCYLGLPRFLPRLRVPEGLEVELTPTKTAKGTVSLEGSRSRLRRMAATGPADGMWMATFRQGDELAGTLRLRLEDRAREIDPTEFRRNERDWREEPEFVSTGAEAATTEMDPRSSGSPPTADMLDLLEAVYSAGIQGWTEPRLYALLAEFTGSADRTPWDAMRVLADGGYLKMQSRRTWRARRWIPRAPALYFDEVRRTLIFEGSIGSILRDRFRGCVEAHGGIWRLDAACGDFSVPVLSASRVDPEAVSAGLGIALTRWPDGVPTPGALEPATTGQTEWNRSLSSTWCWEGRRFRSPDQVGTNDERIELTRHRHEAGRAADIYRVADGHGSPMLLESRSAAILVAHRLAGRSMFEHRPGMIEAVRVSGEGALPHTVARVLARKHLRSAGLRKEVDWKLIYPADVGDLTLLRRLLGPIIDGGNDSRKDGLDVRNLVFGRVRPNMSRLHPFTRAGA